MFENLLNSPILQNPMFVAAILAVIRNLGGYIYNCFEAKKLLQYDAGQFLVTLGLWETVFVILAGGANLNSETTAVIAIALDFIRGLKTAISGTTTSTPAIIVPPASQGITYSQWIHINATTWQRYVYTPNQATTIETVHTDPNPPTQSAS
jgi:hypothetical protein